MLVVDDNSQMRAILDMILSSLGVSWLRSCANGKEALETFRAVPSDFVITDWVMQPKSGLELTRQLRDRETSPYPDVPVIMITSNAAQTGVIQARDAGVTAYLTKPMTARSVYNRIIQVIEKTIG